MKMQKKKRKKRKKERKNCHQHSHTASLYSLFIVGNIVNNYNLLLKESLLFLKLKPPSNVQKQYVTTSFKH